VERETWRLEVMDRAGERRAARAPLTREAGTALDFAGLLRRAERHRVQYLKGVTCNNLGEPLRHGACGRASRSVIWLARPVLNVRRFFYYGYHDDDPAQIFQSSLPIGRVLEDQEDLCLRFDVLTKTKQPELPRYWTTRDRAGDLAALSAGRRGPPRDRGRDLPPEAWCKRNWPNSFIHRRS
jgi:hypothetical protein